MFRVFVFIVSRHWILVYLAVSICTAFLWLSSSAFNRSHCCYIVPFPSFLFSFWKHLERCMLIEGTDNNFQGKWHPLHTLAASGEFYLVNSLLKHNLDINVPDKVSLDDNWQFIYSFSLLCFEYPLYYFICLDNVFCVFAVFMLFSLRMDWRQFTEQYWARSRLFLTFFWENQRIPLFVIT